MDCLSAYAAPAQKRFLEGGNPSLIARRDQTIDAATKLITWIVENVPEFADGEKMRLLARVASYSTLGLSSEEYLKRYQGDMTAVVLGMQNADEKRLKILQHPDLELDSVGRQRCYHFYPKLWSDIIKIVNPTG